MSKIKVVEIYNDFKKFENEVNDLLNLGWKILSSNCSEHGFECSSDSCYQAILIFNDIDESKEES